MSRIGKSIETKSRLMIARAHKKDIWRVATVKTGDKSVLKLDLRFEILSQVIKSVLKLDSCSGYTAL